MTKTFTPNDVLRYFYNEVSKTEKQEIEEFLACDELMQEYYLTLLDTDKKISSMLMEPKKSTISNILTYSRTYCSTN